MAERNTWQKIVRLSFLMLVLWMAVIVLVHERTWPRAAPPLHSPTVVHTDVDYWDSDQLIQWNTAANLSTEGLRPGTIEVRVKRTYADGTVERMTGYAIKPPPGKPHHYDLEIGARDGTKRDDDAVNKWAMIRAGVENVVNDRWYYVQTWNQHRRRAACTVSIWKDGDESFSVLERPGDKSYSFTASAGQQLLSRTHEVCTDEAGGADDRDRPSYVPCGYRAVFYTHGCSTCAVGWVLKPGKCTDQDLNCQD